MRYKIGTKVRVVNPYSGSEFEDGDIVTIIGIGFEDDPDCYEAILSEGDFSWYLREDEVAPLTNGDKIRGMTDEELATLISEIADECEKNTECHQHCYGCDIEYCVYESCLKWLQQPSFCSYGEPKDGD